MEIVKLIVYEHGNEKYTLYFRKNDNFNILQFCEDNDIKEFCICDGERRDNYGFYLRLEPMNFIGARTDYLIDFYRQTVDDSSQDEMYSFWLYSSNPLDYENFCSDNRFYKFQIRSGLKESSFYYCDKLAQHNHIKKKNKVKRK